MENIAVGGLEKVSATNNMSYHVGKHRSTFKQIFFPNCNCNSAEYFPAAHRGHN